MMHFIRLPCANFFGNTIENDGGSQQTWQNMM